MELFTIILFGLVIYVWVQVSGLRSDVDVLKREKGIGGSAAPQGQVAGQSFSPSAVSQAAISQTPGAPRQAPAGMYYPEPYETPAFIRWFSEDWLVKLGAFLVLLGCGWFATYAFAHQWIGAEGRITLGLLFGVAVMCVGVWRISTHVHQGSIFAVLGSTIVLLTTFAARTAYDFFTPLSALVIMTASVVLVAFISVRYKAQSLAIASVILAGIAPFLTASPQPSVMGLFVYVLLVVLGTLWVVYYTGWAGLTLAALGLVGVYSAPFLFMSGGPDQDTVFLFTLVFTALFFVTNIMSMLYQSRKMTDSALGIQHTIAFGTTLHILLWVATAGAEEFRVFLYLAWMLVFALGSFAIFTRTTLRAPFYIYGGMSLVLLGAATSEVFNGASLVIAFTIEVAALAVAALLSDEKGGASQGTQAPLVSYVSPLFALPVFLSFGSIFSSSWTYSVLHKDFFVLCVLALALAGVSVYIGSRPKPLHETTKNLGIAFLIGSGVYVLIIIWLVLHALFAADVATMFALFIYSALGITLYVSGQRAGQKIRSMVGGIVLGGVVMRLLFVEVWQMDLAGRIVTFFVIGILLMSTAFIKRIKK